MQTRLHEVDLDETRLEILHREEASSQPPGEIAQKAREASPGRALDELGTEQYLLRPGGWIDPYDAVAVAARRDEAASAIEDDRSR
jgi:hypothetical protein